jgi:C-terminal processing protease CtpA/Prc
VKFTGKHNYNWRSMAMAMVLAGAAIAQTTPPPSPPAAAPSAPAAAPAAPATPAAASGQDARDAERERRDQQREAEREKREEQRAAERAKQAEARAKAAEDRAHRASSARVHMFGEGAYLGVDVQDVTKDRLPALKLKEERGAEVSMVDQDGPAGKAGLKEGDVILTFNGEKVESAEQLKRMIHETPPGRTVALGVSRNGQALNLNAQLADRRELARSMGSFVMPRVVIPPIPPIEIPRVQVFTTSSTPRVGLSIEPLSPQLGEFFGAPNGQGLLVRSVEKGSPADQAGLKAGDVIIKVGGERISDSGDWRMTMREKTGAVPFTIMRDKREQTVNVKLPDRRSANSTTYFDFDSREFAANMKDFEKNMKDWQKEWEKNGKDWEKEIEKNMKDFHFDFQYDDDDGGRTIVIQRNKTDKQKIEKQKLKPAIVLKEKTAA